MRRNLTGLYIFDKFKDEEKRQPTCFEDCQESTQNECLAGLNREALINLSKRLGNTIKEIGDDLDLIRE